MIEVEDKALRVKLQKEVDSASITKAASKKAEDNACAKSNQQRKIDPAVSGLMEAESIDSGNPKSDIHIEFVKPAETNSVEQEHGKQRRSAMLDFSGCEGSYVLPYEFRAKDKHQEEEIYAEENPANDERQVRKSLAEQSSVDEDCPSDKARDPEEEVEALEDYSKAEQNIVRLVQPLHLPHVFTEVRLTGKLLVFRFGQNYIVDAYIRKIFINYERPIEMSNLVVSNAIVTRHIGRRVAPYIEADSVDSLQPKLLPLHQPHLIFIWVALFASCLANIWSQMRCIFCNYFGCRKLRPGMTSSEIADLGISEEEDKQRCMTESHDIKSVPLGSLIPKPVQQYRLEDKQCTSSTSMDDFIVGASPNNPIIIPDHHVEPSSQEQTQNSFEQNFNDSDVSHHTLQSAERRLEFVETQADSQLPKIGLKSEKVTRLPQAGSVQGGQVHTKSDGAKSSSEKIYRINHLEGGESIKAAPMISSTGGQQTNTKTDTPKTKDKGRNKHKGKKAKVTFEQLLEKYQKISDAKSAYRLTKAKVSESPPVRRKTGNRDWPKEKSENLSRQRKSKVQSRKDQSRQKYQSRQSRKSNGPTLYSPSGPPMPKPRMPPNAYINPYHSGGRYDSRAHHLSYAKSPRQEYVAPKKSTVHQQSHNKDRLNESVRSSSKKKEVVRQVYRVKRDGRKDVVQDSATNKNKPAEVLVTKGKEAKQVTFRDPIAESGQAKADAPRTKENLPSCKAKSQPECPSGLLHWQEKKLYRLQAEELKKRNLAWVPKGRSQGGKDVPSEVAVRAAETKKDQTEANGRSSRKYPSYHKKFRSAPRSYYPAMSFKPAPWSMPPGMIGYHPWFYYDPSTRRRGREKPTYYTKG